MTNSFKLFLTTVVCGFQTAELGKDNKVNATGDIIYELGCTYPSALQMYLCFAIV